MYRIKFLLCFSVLTTITSTSAIAQPLELSMKKLETKIAQQIAKHPEVIAAKQAMTGKLYLADGLEKAIYNPELNTVYEREGSDNNYLIGINQSIDRSNKRGSRTQQAAFARIQAKENYNNIMQNKMAQALTTLVAYQAINDKAKLVLKQEQQLEGLLDIVKQRNKTGDIGQLDTELAYLTLSQKFAQAASIQAEKRRVGAQLKEILPEWQLTDFNMPDTLFEFNRSFEPESLANSHPAVLAAKAQWDVMQITAELAQKNKKADPTFGINVGKVASDNLLSLNCSIPLNLRNNFNNEFKAAIQQALAAESNYLSVKRNQYYAIVGSQEAANEYQMRYRKWKNLMQGRDANSENLLQKQWTLGDISTTEYFLTLQQRTEGLLAGIELEQEYQNSLILLLLDTAQFSIQQATTIGTLK